MQYKMVKICLRKLSTEITNTEKNPAKELKMNMSKEKSLSSEREERKRNEEQDWCEKKED